MRSKALRKDMQIQRFSNALKGEQDVKLASNPKEFFSDRKVKAKVVLDKADKCSLTSDEKIQSWQYNSGLSGSQTNVQKTAKGQVPQKA